MEIAKLLSSAATQITPKAGSSARETAHKPVDHQAGSGTSEHLQHWLLSMANPSAAQFVCYTTAILAQANNPAAQPLPVEDCH